MPHIPPPRSAPDGLVPEPLPGSHARLLRPPVDACRLGDVLDRHPDGRDDDSLLVARAPGMIAGHDRPERVDVLRPDGTLGVSAGERTRGVGRLVILDG